MIQSMDANTLKGEYVMLVLSRMRDEAVIIGDNEVRVEIVDIRGDKVRLGITAPPDVSIHREEVFNEIVRAAKRVD